MVGKRYAGSGCLRVVDKHLDAAKALNSLAHNLFCDGLVVGAGVHIGGNAQHLNAIQALQLFFGCLEFCHVAAGDDQVRALFGICGGNTVANGSAASVLQRGATGARDNDGFTSEKSHEFKPPCIRLQASAE